MDLRRLSLVGLTALIVGGVSPALADVRTFTDPTHEGFPVAFCGASGDVCGQQIALAWCRTQGYEYASDWRVAPGVDFSTTTARIDDGSICRGVQCDSFDSITCGREGTSYRMPALGGLARTTVITPNRRGVEAAIAPVEYQLLIPGCHQRKPGIFLCETIHEYQHCRTLLKSGKVSGCRAGLAFEGAFAEPVAAGPEAYDLTVSSTAQATVYQGRRGEGRLKGDAEFEVSFVPPEVGEQDWCLQRDRYIYYPTGPKGGMESIDDTATCEDEIQGSFEPHEDDLLAAYDMCQAARAWGSRIDQPIELMVAALFHVGSPQAQLTAGGGGFSASIIAPYLTVQAPMRVTCRE